MRSMDHISPDAACGQCTKRDDVNVLRDVAAWRFKKTAILQPAAWQGSTFHAVSASSMATNPARA